MENGTKEDKVKTMFRILVKYFGDVEHIEQNEKGDMIDLRVAEDVEMKQGEVRALPLGVAMQLPDGFEAHVYPRSSTALKHGILMANGVGVIDCSYRGDNDQWHFIAYAIRDTKIEKNTRIAQFRLIRNQRKSVFEVVEMLGNDDRGGIGSTGEK